MSSVPHNADSVRISTAEAPKSATFCTRDAVASFAMVTASRINPNPLASSTCAKMSRAVTGNGRALHVVAKVGAGRVEVLPAR